MVHKSFFFDKYSTLLPGSAEIASLQHKLPQSHNTPTTTFELIVSNESNLWRSRTIALFKDPKHTTQLRFAVNTRSIYKPPIPGGYYGNAVAVPVVQTTAGELSDNPFRYTVKLVQRAKEMVDDKYVKSIVTLNGTLGHGVRRFDALVVTDHRRLGLSLDFGWGLPVYGGYLDGGFSHEKGFVTCFTSFR